MEKDVILIMKEKNILENLKNEKKMAKGYFKI